MEVDRAGVRWGEKHAAADIITRGNLGHALENSLVWEICG